MENKYNLTSKELLAKAILDFGVMSPYHPLGFLVKQTLKLFSTENMIEKQKETAVKIIEAGKKNNVDEVEIILEQKAGLDIESKIQEMGGSMKIGQDGKMHVKIKYK